MSIPVTIDPLGTLGAGEPLPPGFRPLAYVEATKNGPRQGDVPWAGLEFTAFNQETDTLIIDGGGSAAMQKYGGIFQYASSDSHGIGASKSDSKVIIQNGELAYYGLQKVFEPGRIYRFVAAPDKRSIDELTRVGNFEAYSGARTVVWVTGALLARVEHQRSGVTVETVVAAERITDGALGLVSLTTGVFLEV